MKRNRLFTSGLAIAVIASAVSAAVAFDEPKNQQDDQPRNVRAGDRDKAGKLDEKTAGTNVRTSQVMGMNIQNRQGKSVGEISDLVIDANHGRIRYAAVTYGGLLGIGNKMFAVPFEAFECRPNPDDKDEHILVLNVTQEQLDGDRGFDEDHWPNFADREFTDMVDQRYQITREVPAKTDAKPQTAAIVVRASGLHGLNIQNPEGKNVGEIQDLVIDADRAKVRYAAVTYGGFLGLGDKLFAVPYEAFAWRPHTENKGEYVLILNVTQDQLDGAVGFDQDHWPNFADPQFTKELDMRYKIKRSRDVEARRDTPTKS